jgi:hypothetical protein
MAGMATAPHEEVEEEAEAEDEAGLSVAKS